MPLLPLRGGALVTSLCVVTGALDLADSAPVYEVIEIPVLSGTPGSFIDASSGQSVNNAGTVVGSFSLQAGGAWGLIFQNGVTSYLGAKDDALRRYPNWISSNGRVAGSDSSKGFSFLSSTYTLLATNTKLNAINDNGVFVGSSGNYAAWGSGITLTTIMPVSGQPAFEGGVLRAINNAGQMIGEFNRPPSGAYKTGIYRNGSDPILITPPGGYVSALPNDINASGAFAGQLYTEFSGSDGFYCPGIGQTLQVIASFVPTAVADDGSMIGGTRLYQGGTSYQLSQIVNATGTGWTFEAAYDISPDARFITGVGYKNGYRRGFLMRPVSAAAPVITAITRNGATCTIDFNGTAGTTGWKIRGSTSLASFSIDLTSASTITEVTAGNYRAVVTVPANPARYFLRVETP